MNFDIPALLELAERTARAAGEHALKHYDRRRDVDRSLPHDVKLILDRECQDVAEQTVFATAPNHNILGEEGNLQGESEITWIIDPIDGTLNFTHGFPHWGVSVAAQHRTEGVVAGCIFLPMYEECFTVTSDGPALCDGKVLTLDSQTPLNEGMVLTGIRVPALPAAPALDQLSLLMQHAQKTRLMGAAAPDLCWVASGKADAYVDQGLYIWDIAVGKLLLEKAGGVFLQKAYSEPGRFDIIGAHKKAAAELDALLAFSSQT